MRNKQYIFLFLFISTIVFPQKVGESYRLNINNINLPIGNSGVIADINIPPDGAGGKYDGFTFLFSSGFYLSGYSNNQLWTNAIATASLVNDYLTGTVENLNDPDAQLYIVKRDDIPFGISWQDWIDAVGLGADFYDGDNDGIYYPVDKNSNGVWDNNEDAPDLLGDVTAWCVYNDGVPAAQRRWNAVNPIGIEIRQTVFAYAIAGSLSDIIFIRYRIKYVGLGGATEPGKLDTVYFGVWADPDIGDPSNDVAGCDTNLNAGFSYGHGPDLEYGINPPAFFINNLSGPYEFIPDLTFIDINENGIYDDGVDIPLDTAYTMKGQLKGKMAIPGGRNQRLSSFIMYMGGDPVLGDPDEHLEARNYLLGKTRIGTIPDPCTFAYGDILDVNCAEVNPAFWFSGDPVDSIGWLSTVSVDIRLMPNSGPFTLYKNEEKEIVAAYVIGRGGDAISSITKARETAEFVHQFYQSNFDESILPVDDESNNFVSDYKLYQNYPNPFNPVTIIGYQLPFASQISLKVYDVLGREIGTLVNEDKPAGSYEVEFDAASLSSGIYFYELRAGNFIQSKKMFFVK